MRGLAARFLCLLLVCAAPADAHAVELKPWTGGAAPPLELQDMVGKVHRLADYRGSVVLVNFWATWCEPCRAEMPSMDELRASLLRDADSAAWKAWKARMLPASYLVDREGAIRFVAVGEVDWTSEPVKRTVMEMLR